MSLNRSKPKPDGIGHSFSKSRHQHLPVRWLYLLLLVGITTACSENKISLEVSASAYTSSAAETDATPTLAAWGDTLQPGMKAVAVSRDLLDLGLGHNKEIWIEGLPGTYKVLDKMNKRWTKKIDIYMGNDVEKAREWGKQTVTISWIEEKE